MRRSTIKKEYCTNNMDLYLDKAMDTMGSDRDSVLLEEGHPEGEIDLLKASCSLVVTSLQSLNLSKP